MTDTPSELWDGDVYGENTGHHRAFDDEIFAAMQLHAGQAVLDIGCGVGDFTRRVAAEVAPAQVIGIDQAASMIESATAANDAANSSFLVGAAQELGALFPEPASFDLIVSVACLHWVPEADHQDFLAHCHRLLRPGGRLVLSFGGAGNVAEALALVNRHSGPLGGTTDPWFFPSSAQYSPLVSAAGFVDAQIGLVDQLHGFATFADLEGWFDSQFLIAFSGPLSNDQRAELRAAVVAEARTELRRDDGSWDQGYVRLVASANKAPEVPLGL